MTSRVRVLAAFLVAFPLVAQKASVPRRVSPHEVTAAEIARERDGRRVQLGAVIFDPLTERPDFQAVGLPRGIARTEYAIVQLSSPAAKGDLERAGVRFFGYLPDNAYQVRMSPAVRETVAANAAVRWIGDYEPGFKVHPRLWPAKTEEIRSIRVVPFADLPVSKLVALLQVANPAIETTKAIEGRFVELTVPAGNADEFIRKAAAIEGVRWIEPDDGLQLHNSSTAPAIQGNQPGETGRTIFAHGITGTGQIVGIIDSGLDSDMCYFRNLNGVNAVTDATDAATAEPGPLFPQNKVLGYWIQEGANAYDEDSMHGTHTTGTLAGDNFAHPSSATDPGIDPVDGMAPNAQIIFQDIGASDGKLRGGDPYVMFLQALNGGARVHSNSYGSPSKGAYTAYDQIVDAFAFDHDEMTIVFSAGNDGPADKSIGSPANAKNVITVGNGASGTGTGLSFSSSRGPTQDGRIKPDIIAPGSSIVSASGSTSHTDGNCGAATKSGTSMAAPAVAGGAALVRQYFRDGFYPTGVRNANDGFNAPATLVKAVLLNGTLALPAGEAMGNFRFGWGKIFLDNNLYFAGDSRRMRLWDIPNAQGLKTDESLSFDVSVATGQPVRVTLVWTDPEGTPGAAKALVNDLDLSVTNGSGTYLGNVFATAGESTTGGNADRLNNVEQVIFNAPVGGKYTVNVRAASVPGNGRSGTDRQGFALVVSAANCTTAVSAVPGNVRATTNPTRGVDISWTQAPGSTVTQVYRATGANPNPADFRFIGSSKGNLFTDLRAQGGYTYSYLVRAADDCSEGPRSEVVTINAAGLCDIAPTFDGINTAEADGTNCRIRLAWGTGNSNCPLAPTVRYHIYRSTSPDFVPSGTPYATTTQLSFDDTNVVSGVTYHYIVRAEDFTTGSGGPTRGNVETNMIRLFATAFGAPSTPGTWRDGAGDDGAYLTPEVPWQITTVQAHSGTRSYHNAADHDLYRSNTCASLVTPAVLLDASAELSYWVRYNLEWEWDGIIVEISEDGGSTWKDLPPTGGYPATLDETQGTSKKDPPANVCGYLFTQGAFTGPSDNASLTEWKEYKSSLAAYAGKTVKIRWRFASDPGLEFEGFYLDDIAISNVRLPGPCTPILTSPVASFELVPGLPAKGKPVQFRDRSANVPTAWAWQFGDGGVSTQQNPTHTYANTGTYIVTLTVTNGAGTQSVSRTITVAEPSTGGKRRSVH
jgi:hypothetical protein